MFALVSANLYIDRMFAEVRNSDFFIHEISVKEFLYTIGSGFCINDERAFALTVCLISTGFCDAENSLLAYSLILWGLCSNVEPV